MRWVDACDEFETASGMLSVNSSPDGWCLLDVDPLALRAAADKVVEDCLQLHKHSIPAEWWLDLVRLVPNSGKPDDVRWWVVRCMVPSSSERTEHAAPRVMLSVLRERGILLWPVGVCFGDEPWDGQAYKRYLLHSSLGLTEFELGLLGKSELSLAYCKSLLMACSPTEDLRGLSLPGLLHALGVATRLPGWQADLRHSPAFWLIIFRNISFLAEEGDEAGLGAAEQAELVIRRERERERDDSLLGPFARRPDAREIVEAFEFVSSVVPRKRLMMSCVGQKVFLEYLATTYNPIPPLNEMTREGVITGPTGFVAWLEHGNVPRSTAYFAMFHTVELFEQLCDRGLIDASPARLSDIPSRGQGGSSSDKLLIPEQVARGAEQVLMELCEHALRQGEELEVGDWRPVRDVRSALPQDLPDGPSLLPRGLVKPEGFIPRIVTLRTSDGRYARILDASVFVILLYLHRHPNRTIQARLADSGEFDEMVPMLEGSRDEQGLLGISATWRANPNPLAIPGRRQGVIREIQDTVAGDSFLGFWISSNKSQEGGHADGQDRGFESPFEDPVLSMLFWRLGRLNGRINPADRLLSRDELGDIQLKSSKALEGVLPKYVYLFRSAANSSLAGRLAPPTHGVVALVYFQVLDEVEARLRIADQAEAGTRDGLGGPDRKLIIGRSGRGIATDSIYSLHGLRVTGLTNMVRHGVPLWAISKLVASHATLKMTMRYIKVEAGEIRAAMAKAASASSLEGLWHEAQRAAACTPEELALRYASDHPCMADSPRQPIGFWQARHDGICPNGETGCSTGGPLVFGRKVRGPVEGGARNCPLCRHFLTGPKFLPGQVALFNAGLFRARRQSEGLRELRRAYLDADSPTSQARLGDRISRSEAELDVTIKTLNARYRLLKKSEVLSALDERGEARPDEAEGDLLITRSSPDEVALNLRLTTELGFLDTVARVAALVPELSIQDAILERNLLVDRLLDRDGYDGLCYRLPKPEAAVAGDAFVDGVRAQAEPSTDPDRLVDDVYEGRRRLFDLDMDRVAAEVSSAIGRAIPIARRTSLAGPDLAIGCGE